LVTRLCTQILANLLQPKHLALVVQYLS